ncbi:MAG: phosphohydrolase [Gemmatimonadota bacterium]|nr:MAG: phosphohydrolase [Gemmatimonadota bacterium]
MKNDDLTLTREQRAERTRATLGRVGNIPTLPPVLLQVWDLTNQQNTSARDLARVIESDPGLTGALLRLSNSAYFGFPRKVATVTQAVVVLGFDTVKSLAMGASVFRALPSPSAGLDPSAFFHHSLMTAMASRVVMERRQPSEAGAAFSAGILHDLGKLVIGEYLSKAVPGIERRVGEGLAPEDAETEELGLSHAEIGAWFATSWNFPDELTEAVQWHHRPADAPRFPEIVASVHLGDVLAHRVGATGSGRSVAPEPDPAALAGLGLHPDDLEGICEQIASLEIGASRARETLGA